LVKAFNDLTPEKLITSQAHHSAGRRVVFFSGNHLRAKREIARLIDHLGFAGIDLGGLAEGGRFQQFPDGRLRGLNLIKVANDTDMTMLM
jgi:predicted dinucleotide-binding enzyme